MDVLKLLGSKHLTDNFIKPQSNNQEDYARLGIKNIRQFYPGCPEDFYKTVQEMYDIVLSYVDEKVLDACEDEDRSDIKVFLAIIAILAGDTRYQVLNWLNHTDINTNSLSEFKEAIKLVGYEWINPTTKTMVINNNKQRLFASLFFSTMKDKGTVESIKAIVKYFYMNPEDTPNIGDVSVVYPIEEGDFKYKQGIGINSRYLDIEIDSNNNPIPIRDSVNNAYIKIIKSALENVRPAGIPFVFASKVFNLSPFDGGTYWRHRYGESVQPWDRIDGSSILQVDDHIYVKVTMSGSTVLANVNYQGLIASFRIDDRDFLAMDMSIINYEDIKDLSYENGVISNSYYAGCKSYSGLYNDGALEYISELNFDMLNKKEPYLVDFIEIVRS